MLSQLKRLETLRGLDLCILTPSITPGRLDAYMLAGGRVTGPGDDARLRPARRGPIRADDLDALLVLWSFLRRPRPELTILPLGRRDCTHAA